MTFPIAIIGASIGCMDALPRLFQKVPPNLPAAVLIVVHRAEDFESNLAAILTRNCRREICEPSHGEVIVANHTYLAPAGYHTLIEQESFSMSTEGPVLLSRPSIDVAMDSAAHAFRSRAIGIVLTGASRDGAAGSRAIAAAGGCVMHQSIADAYDSTAPAAVAEFFPNAFSGCAEELGAELVRLSTGALPC